MEEFGRLLGFEYLLAGGFGFIVQPVLTWAQRDGFLYVRKEED